MSPEEWRAVPGFTHYEASDQGRIRTTWFKPCRVLLTRPHRGYPHVRIVRLRGGRPMKLAVHRLVLLAFAGLPPEGKNVTRHLDGTRDNNRPANLAWGTPQENSDDAKRHGTAGNRRRGERASGARLTDGQYVELTNRAMAGENGRKLAAEFNVHVTWVYQLRRGRGRRWR